MSRWHRPQVSLVRKKSAGITSPVVVRAEDGKNGLSGPSPSPSIVAGGRTGFTMRCAARQSASHAARTTGVNSAAAARARRAPRTARGPDAWTDGAVRHRCAATRTAPAADAATCRSSSHSYGRVAPSTSTPQPNSSPPPRRPRPAARRRSGGRPRRTSHAPAAIATVRPSSGCATTLTTYARDAPGAATSHIAFNARTAEPASRAADKCPGASGRERPAREAPTRVVPVTIPVRRSPAPGAAWGTTRCGRNRPGPRCDRRRAGSPRPGGRQRR